MINAQSNSKWKFTKIGLLLFFVGLDIFYNCTYPLQLGRFTYYKKPIQGEIPFRMDGYYYNESCNKIKSYSQYCFFYPDGFFMAGSFMFNSDRKQMDIYIDSIFHIKNQSKKCVWGKGAFIVEKDILKIQLFPSQYEGRTFEYGGKILNDSTISLKIDVQKGILREVYPYPYPNIDFCDTFHFRKMSWKPDSTYQIGFDKRIKKKTSRER